MATTRVLEWLGRLYIWLLLAFLYVPIIIMALMSFNVSPFYQLPFEWTTEWYASLWQNDQLISATWNSLEIAVITTIICVVLGSAASLALYRYEFRGKKFLQALLFPPIAIPWLITGTAMLIFFFGVGIGRGLFAILLGHVALAALCHRRRIGPAADLRARVGRGGALARRQSMAGDEPRHAALDHAGCHCRRAVRFRRVLRPVRRILLSVDARPNDAAGRNLRRDP